MRFCLSCPVHHTCAWSSTEHMTVPVGKCPSSLTLPILRDQKVYYVHGPTLEAPTTCICDLVVVVCVFLPYPLWRSPRFVGALFKKECGCWVGLGGSNIDTRTLRQPPKLCGHFKAIHACSVDNIATSDNCALYTCPLGWAALLRLQTAYKSIYIDNNIMHTLVVKLFCRYIGG